MSKFPGNIGNMTPEDVARTHVSVPKVAQIPQPHNTPAPTSDDLDAVAEETRVTAATAKHEWKFVNGKWELV